MTTALRHKRGTQVGDTEVSYHGTVVFEVVSDYIYLDNGGWWTTTMKHRINEAASLFNQNIGIHQDKYEWFVTTQAGVYHWPRNATRCRVHRRTGAVQSCDGKRFALKN